MQKQTKNILSDDFIADHTANLIYTTIVGSKNATPDSHNIKKPLKSKNLRNHITTSWVWCKSAEFTSRAGKTLKAYAPVGSLLRG